MTDDLKPLTEDEVRKKGRKRLLDLVEKGGKASRTFKCQACATPNTVEFEVIDSDEHVRAMKYLDDSAKKENAETVNLASIHANQLRTLSDEELWDLYVRVSDDAGGRVVSGATAG